MTPDEYEKRELERIESVVGAIAVKQDVGSEIAGKRPPGGIASWQAHWNDMLKGFEEDPKYNKYIEYIILKRHEAGLLPLEGYPPEKYISNGGESDRSE